MSSVSHLPVKHVTLSAAPRVSETLLLTPSSPACFKSARAASAAGSFLTFKELFVLSTGLLCCHVWLLSSSSWENELPFVLVVTPLSFWVCMKGGTERGGVEEEIPYTTSLHPSLPQLFFFFYWPLSIVPASTFPPIRADSSGVRGEVRPFMEVVVFEGPLCWGMRVHSHHLLATNTATKARRHTDTVCCRAPRCCMS